MIDRGLDRRQWQGLFAAHPAIVLLVDPVTGELVDANEAAAAFYGVDAPDAAARSIAELVRSAQDDTTSGGASSAARDGRRARLSTRHQLASGELREVEVATAPVIVEGRSLLNAVVYDLTERRRTLAALAASEEFARSIVTNAPIGIAVTDLEGRLIRVNQTMSAITGYPEHELLGRDHGMLSHPEDRDALVQASALLHRGEVDAYQLEQRYVRADGSPAHVSVRTSYLRDGDGQVRFQLTVVEDVSERQLARQRSELLQAQLTASHRRFEALVEHASDPIVVMDEDRTPTYLSPAAAAFLGTTHITLSELAALIRPADRELAQTAWSELVAARGGTRQLSVQLRRSDGRARHLAVTMSDLRQLDAVGGIVISARDLTDELTARSRLEHQTTHDGLTGLPNRDLLLDELRRAVDRTRAGQDPYVLLLLDLVGMAGINDRIGHRTGDFLLRSVGQRLQEAVGEQGLVARTSGDEFGVLVPGGATEADAQAVAERFARLFDEPFETPGSRGTVLLRACVGVGLTAAAGGAPTDTLRDATLALSAAEASETGTVRVCDDALRVQEERRLALDYELSTPTILDQLTLVYQPLLDLTDGSIACLETLLRWDHPTLGEISPTEFVPVAERNGAIVPIGTWVLRSACAQLAAWAAEGIGDGVTLAINVSARQLLDIDLVPTLAATLSDTGLDPERIALEITETALADESEVTTATVEAIADLGVRIHIDDFGTGYSSFAQLGRFPFHGLKIDRSFITPLGVESDAVPVLQALLAIAHAQGLEVIAEGVDDEQQAEVLRTLGCPQAQGFLWARPMTAEQVPPFLASAQLTLRTRP